MIDANRSSNRPADAVRRHPSESAEDDAFNLRRLERAIVKEMRVAAALLWYSQGEISQSKAAEIAGTSRAKFIDELSHRRIPVVQVTTEELQDEIHRE